MKRNESISISEAFDTERFRRLGHSMVDQIAEALDEARKKEVPVRLAESPGEAVSRWKEWLHRSDDSEFNGEMIREVMAHSFRCHHPHNLGHQVGAVLPLVAAIDLMGSFLDTGCGVYEVGNPSTPMEHVVIQELAKRIGYPGDSDGFFTSGGSLGNLTALLVMRQQMTGSWDRGSHEKGFAVLVSEEAHYSISRAVKVMGWGTGGLVPVPVDLKYRLKTDQLAAGLENAVEDGRQVIGVIGAAGSTATGSIDPLDEIADFCEENKLWFHADAAHSGAFVFSEKAKPILRGLERADSIVIDFHKMLMSPSLLTAVMFRRSEDSFHAFAQKADYLWRQDDTSDWWDVAKRSMECTRPMFGLRAFALLKIGGDGLFEEHIDRSLDHAKVFADIINNRDDFELLVEPQSNILCYRYVSSGMDEDELNAINGRIRQAIVDSGDFYIVQVEKHGKTYLRSALMNPLVDESVFESLLDKIVEIVKRQLDGDSIA